MRGEYGREECLSALRHASQILGKSPTRREYEELEIRPSASAIARILGSWDEAKLEAGLQLSNQGADAKPVRADFFATIDDATTAYWLGFLFGDGSLIIRNERTGKATVQLSLQEEDETHLRRFRQCIRAENAIITDDGMRTLRIGDQQFAEHLMDKGFTTDKGTNGVLPDLNDWELRRAFIRGLADADGYYGEQKFTITDANSRRLRNLRPWFPVPYDIVEENYDGRSWAYLRVGKTYDLNALYGWLFPGREQTVPAMPRKKRSALARLRNSLDR